MRRLALASSFVLALFVLVVAAVAGPAVNTADGVAIQGHDPVAYFNDNKPVKGSPSFSATHAGATYHFASAANRDAFVATPEKYVPRYGGFCAYGVSQGYKVKIDPAAFTIVDGQLYLNYDLSVRERWRKDTKSYISTADKNWVGLKDK